MKKEPVVGLFGTCGTSKWRDDIIDFLKFHGIPYFNPLREDWKHEYIAEENKHLNEDDIIVFAITNETNGFGSLGEIGFSFLNSLKSEQKVIIYIENDCADPKSDPKTIKESVNARALVKTKVVDAISIKGDKWFMVENFNELKKLLLKIS